MQSQSGSESFSHDLLSSFGFPIQENTFEERFDKIFNTLTQESLSKIQTRQTKLEIQEKCFTEEVKQLKRKPVKRNTLKFCLAELAQTTFSGFKSRFFISLPDTLSTSFLQVYKNGRVICEPCWPHSIKFRSLVFRASESKRS